MDAMAYLDVVANILAINDIPMLFLTIAHGFMYISAMYPIVSQQHWLFSLVVSVAGCVTGGTIRAVFIFNGPPSWLLCNYTIPTYILVWYLYWYSPGKIVAKITHFPPVRMVLIVGDSLLTVSIIVKAIETSLELYPNAVVAALISGLFGGIGGSLWKTWVKAWINPHEQQYSEFSRPSMTIRISIYYTLFYYIVRAGFLPASIYGIPVHTRLAVQILSSVGIFLGMYSYFRGRHTPQFVRGVEWPVEVLLSLGTPQEEEESKQKKE